MTRLALSVLAAALFVGLAGSAGAEEHPFKKAKVGDWIEYKSETSLGQGPTFSMKQSVTAKTAKEATVKVEMKLNGKAMPNMPGQEIKVPLDQEFDPMKLASQSGVQGKAEKLGEGEDAITVNGKKLNCKWVEVKTTTSFGGKEVEAKSKIWLAKEGVPLGGMVRVESDVTTPIAMKTKLEATGWGRGK